jgi:exonuclease SbcC
MRLHRLRLQAFGPYPTPQVVDFDELSSSGLFLLEGPTGAGKSSVLDAVTFALYGELASDGSGKDRLHSHFADPATTPEVALEWSVRGRRLRVTRSPEHQRPRKRGEGMTTQAAQVHLEELDTGSWRSVSSNKAEVGDIVTDLMGLNRAQFTQVVLLPQGQFAQFLQADDDARRALLTKLFGTHLYDRITAELDERRRSAEVARREAGDRIAQAVAAAGQAAGLDDDARRLLVDLTPDDLADRIETLGETLATADQQARVAAALARDALERSTVARDAARTRAEQVRRAIDAAAALAEHEATRDQHTARVERVRLARRAEPVRALLAALASSEAAVDAATAAVRELAPDADPAMLAGQDDGDLTTLAAAATREAGALSHARELERGLAERRSDLTGRRAALADAEASAAYCAERVERLPAVRAELRTRAEADRDTAALLPALRGELAGIDQRLQAAAELSGLDLAIRRQQRGAATAAAAARKADRAHQDGVRRRIAGMSAELAADLLDGEPCAVCGSTTHPSPATAPDEPVTAEDVERLQAARTVAEERRSELDRALAELLAHREELHTRVGDDVDVATLTGQLADLRERAAGAAAAEQRQAANAAAVAAAEAEVDAAQDELTGCTAAVAALRQQVADTAAALARDEAVVAQARGDRPTVAAHHAELTATAKRAAALAVRLADLRTALATGEEARGRVAAEATVQGFATPDDARAAVLDPAELEALATEVEAWQRRHAGLVATVAETGLPDVDVTDAEAALTALESAEQEWRSAEEVHQQADRCATTTARTAAAWHQCIDDLRRAREEHARTLRDTAAAVRLAGLAKGTEGQRRVALTTYVLRHWFAQVVAAANVRLARMSAGRYELERSDQAESRTRRAGLTLTVVDRYTGERRHPRSLSGGETFFTSLALALGLAEVVKAEAGGVDLDTLFIDEGFGSLDAATLDQVMDVIDDLRDRGRVVGIVSHLPDLKERVPERLEVRPASDGSSTLRVVA